MSNETIVILDFGSQYTQLIARKLRKLNVYCEILPFHTDENKITEINPKGIILSGGPNSLTNAQSPRAPDFVFSLGCPVLGICYGMQTMVEQLGGIVENANHHEYGEALVEITEPDSPILHGIEDKIDDKNRRLLSVWMSHGDRVIRLPEGFTSSARTKSCPHAAISNLQKHFYGLQFHPEVTHTKQGERLLSRFVLDICGCQNEWVCDTIIDEIVDSLQKKIGSAQVILGLSGGVDSQVAAALLHRAIGKQLICVYVDTGLMRQNETDEVLNSLSVQEGVNIQRVDAKNLFLSALKGENCPEKKRKIIGKLFVDIFSAQAKKYSDVKFLAQGTIYSDVIESAASSLHSHVIKSHHNVGGLPEKLDLDLVEPLRTLFKDEVREIGLALGLPYDCIYRHPFPGPGLAVRILGEVKEEYVDILRKADAIFIEELKAQNLYQDVSQAFAVFLPVKSTGVGGDARKYDYVIALRAVKTTDFMTAHWAFLPHEFYSQVASRILNEVSDISRVTLDISNKPPATIEWE